MTAATVPAIPAIPAIPGEKVTAPTGRAILTVMVVPEVPMAATVPMVLAALVPAKETVNKQGNEAVELRTVGNISSWWVYIPTRMSLSEWLK